MHPRGIARQRGPEQKRRAWLRQAVTLHRDGNLEGALPLYQRVLRSDPQNTDALYGAGMLAWQLGMLDEAVRMMRTVVARRPQDAEAHYNLGVCLQSQRQLVQAFAEYQTALEIRPTFPDAWGNLGSVLYELGDADSAKQCYAKALTLAPPESVIGHEARYNASYPALMMGDYTNGWACYESRFDAPVFKNTYVRRHDEPAWGGGPLQGRTLLVHAEQGFGDSIMMGRYLHQMPADGRVVVEVQRPLLELFQATWPAVTIYAQGDPTPCPIDVQMAMMSAPHRFGTTLGTVPATVPYLTVPQGPTLPAPANPDDRKIVFAWAGSKDHKQDRRRSIPLELFRTLGQVPGVTWYSAQLDMEPVAFAPACHSLKPLIHSFADTAALVAQADLVICCDTALGHLAGALGKPVWVLLPAWPDYRWMLDREDTPWYPTMRLFRQAQANDWPGVLTRVVEALRV